MPRGDDDIFIAIQCGKIGAVRHILRMRPWLATLENSSSSTPLHMAADKGRAEICQVLLAAGAQVNAYDYRGLSAMMMQTVLCGTRFEVC